MNRARVLLADDNQPLLELIAAMLASSFDVIGLARDGPDLIAKARNLTPDIIITDITMPLMTGIQAIHELQQGGSGAKFVFLTVHQESEFLQACQEEGALGYVVKSRIKADLIPAIHAAMAGERFVSPSLSNLEGRSVNSVKGREQTINLLPARRSLGVRMEHKKPAR